MKDGIRGLLVGALSLVSGALWFSSSASAQAPGVQGQPTTRQERPDAGPATARAAENYDPVGVPVGSFRLFPELEFDEVYNDNIYAVSNATGKTGSFIQVVKPTLSLRSDWSRHMLNMFANAGFGFYSTDNLNNYADFAAGTEGRYDIQRDWNVYGGASFNRRHEERGSPNTPATAAGFPPNMYNQVIGNAGYFQAFNRFSVRLDGRVDNYNYINVGPGVAAGAIPNFDRNRTEFRESVRFGYEFSPGFQVWTRGGLNQRQYQYSPDTQGFFHNSSGFDVVAGVTVDFGGITSIEAFAGYIQQVYVDSRYSTVSAPTFGLTGYWNPMRELWVKPFVRRTVEEAALTTASAYLATAFGVDVDYRVLPNVRVDGHVDYMIASYNDINGAAGEYDQYLTFRAGVMYLPTPNFFIGPTYAHVNRNSNIANTGFDQNIIMLRLGTRL